MYGAGVRTKFKGIACVLAVASVIVSCGGDDSSRDRNVSAGSAASVIGTSCKELGKITKKKGISYVCARVKPRAGAAAVSFGPKSGILYGVAVVKNWRCEKLGGTRYQNGIFSVCSGGKSRKSRKWALTTPLPLAVAALVDAAETSRIGSLEEAGVAVPLELAPGPADIAAEQQAQAVSGDGTGPIVGTTTTSLLPPAYVVKLAPDASSTSPTKIAPKQLRQSHRRRRLSRRRRPWVRSSPKRRGRHRIRRQRNRHRPSGQNSQLRRSHRCVKGIRVAKRWRTRSMKT